MAIQALAPAGRTSLTKGDHVRRQREVYSFLATDERIVRPADYPAGGPGRGVTVLLDAALISAEGGRATAIEAFGVSL